jgi:hypothetical protein
MGQRTWKKERSRLIIWESWGSLSHRLFQYMKAGILFVLGGFCLVQLEPAIAGQVVVPNYSFETPISGRPGPNDTIEGWQFGTVSVGSGSAIAMLNGGVEGNQYLNIQGSTSSLGSSIQVTVTSLSNLVTIAPGTTYTLTVAMNVGGPGGVGTISLLAGGNSAASASIFGTGPSLTDRTASFITLPSGDPLVGQPLTVQLACSCNVPFGGVSASFDNVRLTAEAGPQLKIVPLAGAQTQISWPTNFGGYTLMCSTNLSSTNWTTVSNGAAVQDGQYVVTLQPAARQNFYRLRQP